MSRNDASARLVYDIFRPKASPSVFPIELVEYADLAALCYRTDRRSTQAFSYVRISGAYEPGYECHDKRVRSWGDLTNQRAIGTLSHAESYGPLCKSS
jgi:hypothetical protein